jgi:hypothetical protein
MPLSVKKLTSIIPKVGQDLDAVNSVLEGTESWVGSHRSEVTSR